MRFLRVAGVFLCVFPVLAQKPSELSRAENEIERLRQLVAAGAVAPARLEEAEAALGDAQDYEILQRTLFGNLSAQDLTEDQGRQMIAAAQRRYDRQQKKLEQRQRLVDAGVMARGELQALEEELASRQLTLDLANSRAKLIEQIIASARREFELEQGGRMQTATSAVDSAVMVHFEGDGQISPADIRRIAEAYQREFHKPLPVSANGETNAHRALGFDHRGRVDVALNPDQKEGVWLRAYLEKNDIPYYAFRAAVPGKATGAHIHIGPGSARLRAAD
jgi:hypothetical protein